MLNISRRTFSQLMILIPASFVLNKTFSVEISDKNLNNTLLQVYHYWLQIMASEPEEHFKRYQIRITQADEVKAQVINDFKNKNTVNLNGYILSKTEVAYLALLGKHSG